MTRDELQDRLVRLAKDAGDAGYYFLCSILYYVAGAFARGHDHELAETINRWSIDSRNKN